MMPDSVLYGRPEVALPGAFALNDAAPLSPDSTRVFDHLGRLFNSPGKAPEKRPAARSRALAPTRWRDDLTVFVIDPDPATRDAFTLALAYRGYCVRQFVSHEEFAAARSPGWRGCVLATLDASLGAGLEPLQEAYREERSELPPMPIVLTALSTDLGSVRRAFLAGAIDVLLKPVDLDELLAAIDRAMTQAQRSRLVEPVADRTASIPLVLTRRESEVAQLMRLGFSNRSIGDRLGISHRTVEVHKTRLMRKLGLRSLAELMALPAPK